MGLASELYNGVTMPLHLLHHKSWHVYNTENVEKVRRDQENAQRKEEEEEMRMNQADQERRLQQLRGNAYGVEARPSDVDIGKASNHIPGLRAKKNGHINLFEDFENAQTAKKVEGNPAREAEKAAEQKKWENMVTSKFVNATTDHRPWYSQIDKVSALEKEKSEVEHEKKEKKEARWKESADPLKQMGQYLEKKKEVEEKEKRKKERLEKEMTEQERRRGRGRTPENTRRVVERRHRHRERSRSRSPQRKHRRHRHRSRSVAADIGQLRAEREKREAAEEEKIARLLKGDRKNDRYEAVGYGGYSAQFNPAAVRR